MLEIQPWKAVQNNIAGTQNLIEIAKKYKVKRFVFVSTDKAVRPTNIMGASKRIAEMLIQSQDFYHKSTTKFMIVRFGNVAGSVGSVIPLFKKQIKHGGPITVTHPDVTRYFMLIHEACQLILQAGAMGNGSGARIYILDMGTPIKIADMAKDLIQLSGLQADIDINIKYVGLRPGEKLYEELITEGEGIIKTNHEKILVLEGKYENPVKLNGNIEELIKQATIGNEKIIRDMLKDIVPEYTPASLN
jgi:FlaA1/EpsC-like NDP-sugar epimerase